MPPDDHIHQWRVLRKPDVLSCTSKECLVVSRISVAIANAQADAAHQAKTHILVRQLRDGDLKKKAYDTAYNWVIANAPADTVKFAQDIQESLL